MKKINLPLPCFLVLSVAIVGTLFLSACGGAAGDPLPTARSDASPRTPTPTGTPTLSPEAQAQILRDQLYQLNSNQTQTAIAQAPAVKTAAASQTQIAQTAAATQTQIAQTATQNAIGLTLTPAAAAAVAAKNKNDSDALAIGITRQKAIQDNENEQAWLEFKKNLWATVLDFLKWVFFGILIFLGARAVTLLFHSAQDDQNKREDARGKRRMIEGKGFVVIEGTVITSEKGVTTMPLRQAQPLPNASQQEEHRRVQWDQLIVAFTVCADALGNKENGEERLASERDMVHTAQVIERAAWTQLSTLLAAAQPPIIIKDRQGSRWAYESAEEHRLWNPKSLRAALLMNRVKIDYPKDESEMILPPPVIQRLTAAMLAKIRAERAGQQDHDEAGLTGMVVGVTSNGD